MPSYFQRRDPETGETVDVPYYDVAEVAAILHVSEAHVRRRAKQRDWPHENLGRIWFSLDHIERIHELSTIDPDALTTNGGPARLGTPLTDDDMQGIR